MIKKSKRLIRKGISFGLKIMPAIVPALLVIHANSTACIINGQPKPPQSLKKYRKF